MTAGYIMGCRGDGNLLEVKLGQVSVTIIEGSTKPKSAYLLREWW
jgi:hypothetical protein